MLGGSKVKKRFKSISLIVVTLVLSLVFGSVPPVVTPAEASTFVTLNEQRVETRRIGAEAGRGGVELARAESLRTAMQHASVAATVYLSAGHMLIQHGSRELLVLAGSRTAFLTTDIGTAAPRTASVTLNAMPRTVARELFVPFAGIVQNLGGSLTNPRVATLAAAVPVAPFAFDAANPDRDRDVVIHAVYGQELRMIGRGASFPNTLYGSTFAGTALAAPAAPWLEDYFAASQDLSGPNPENRVGYNRINIVAPHTPLSRVPDLDGGATSGSGMGVDAVRMRLADFGGTDMISQVPADVRAAYPLIPTAKGGVAVIFNLVDANGVRINHLNMTADVIANIYLGRISRWNDPALVRLNPRVALPDAPIQVNWRPDVSGTTEIFTAYLNAASRVWRNALAAAQRTTVDTDTVVTAGVGGWTAASFDATAAARARTQTAISTSIADLTEAQRAVISGIAPGIEAGDTLLAHLTSAQLNALGRTATGAAADGGSRLRDRVIVNANSIGFVSFGDVTGRNVATAPVGPIGIARVQNRAGSFLLPFIDNVYAAGIGHGNIHAHPVNSANPGAYPITGLTWIMVEANPATTKSGAVHIDSVQIPGVDTHIPVATGLAEGSPELTAALQRNAVVEDFIRWAVVQGFGDAEARRLHMAPLTPAMKLEANRLLDTIRHN
jgi:ABC-type phosphate transport system substrate-binding protein